MRDDIHNNMDDTFTDRDAFEMGEHDAFDCASRSVLCALFFSRFALVWTKRSLAIDREGRRSTAVPVATSS